MSTICGHCRLPIANGETGVRHFGHYVAHTENRCVSLLSAEIERLRARVALLEPVASAARIEIEHLRARVASLEESLHYANGTADLAMKHRDDAEKRVAELERDRVHAGVDICEVAAAVEVVRVMEIVKEVAGVVANLHEGPFRHGFEAACEEIEHRLRPCEHCDTALAKDGA